jgi:hypothetical protein
VGGVLAFSDPVPRATKRDGRVVMPGHIGRVYKGAQRALPGPQQGAHAAPAAGRDRVLRPGDLQDPGQVERGWVYAVEQLVAAGAVPPILTQTTEAGLRAWLAAQLPR